MMITVLHAICMTAVSHAFHTRFMTYMQKEERRQELKSTPIKGIKKKGGGGGTSDFVQVVPCH